MNQQSKTFAFVGVAVVSGLIAWSAWNSSQPKGLDDFPEVGLPFFPDFDDATEATQLAVVDYDNDTRETVTFSVQKNDDGTWVIPSHHNYPAEAKERLAKTATSLLGVKKTAVQSRNEADWKRFGVVDPSSQETATDKQRGQRLTLNDASDNALVDLIIGNEVEGRSGHYYVREPEKSTTYVTELDIDLSAKFSDWIEEDLLKISSSDVIKLKLDNYSIDEQQGAILRKELLEFSKKDLSTTGDWTLADLDDETEELDKSPVSSIATNLDQLKIVGVRPKPEGLGANMKIHPAFRQILEAQMQAQGYFIGPDPDGEGDRLYSNEGELVAGINNGVQYTLYFGEIARGTGKDIEVGGQKEDADGEEKKDGDDADESAADDEEDGPRRYLLVKVDLNESLLGEKPVAPVEPVKPAILKEKAEAADKADSDGGDGEAPKKDEADGKDESEGDSDDDGSCGPFDEEKADDAADKADDSGEKAAEGESTDEAADKTESADSTDSGDADASQGKADDEKPPTNEKDGKESPEETKDSDSATDEKSEKKEETPKAPEKSPKELAQEAYDAALASYDSEKRTYESDLKSYESKLEKGKKAVEELNRRFDGWYYVISSDSYEKFKITRNDVVSAKEKEEESKDGEQDDTK